MTYAARTKRGDRGWVWRRRIAMASCSETTPRTTHFVRGSWPISFVTWGHREYLPTQSAGGERKRIGTGMRGMGWQSRRTDGKGKTYFRVGFHDRHPPCSMWLLCHEPEKVRWVLRRASKPRPIVLLGRTGYLCPAGRTTLGERVRAAKVTVVCACMRKSPIWVFPESAMIFRHDGPGQG